MSGFRPDSLDLACAGGELVWIGAGPGRVRLYLRENVPLLHPHPEEREHQLLDVLARRGASFFSDLVADVGGADRAVLADLWELVWAGLVTNDAWEPLRTAPRFGRCRLPPRCAGVGGARPTSSLPAARGRWSLVAPLLLPAATPRERARALAEVLLERHGVVTRAAVLAEGVPGGFTAVYGELRAMEEAGVCQRGYFIEGLGGAQFALPAAVERLRDLREADPRAEPVVVGAADPANPFGVTAPWPEAARKPARSAGAWLALVEGRPAVYVEKGGRGLVTFEQGLFDAGISALAAAVAERRIRRITPERIDGRPIQGDPAEQILLNHGFLQTHRRLVLR